MKFRWDKKYLYWGVTGFAVICASLLFYFAAGMRFYRVNAFLFWTVSHGCAMGKNS